MTTCLGLEQVLERLSREDTDQHTRLQITYYIQYQLHLQLLEVTNYAELHRVAIKGDLPIGVSAASHSTL